MKHNSRFEYHSEKVSKHFDQNGSNNKKKLLFILVALAK